MKKMELFYFLFAVLMLFIFAAPVSATDLDATTCIGTGWSWDAGTNNCTVSGDVYISDVTIPAGTTLYINNLGNFYTNATITNFGTINNVGIINIVGTIINKCGGTFTNSGNFLGNPVQYESCTPPSVMDLNESTCIDIIGGYWISNICTVNASYNVSSGITLNINNGITLQIGGILGNFGTININDGGIFENLGNVYNQGTIFNACSGTFTNNGTFDGVPVQYATGCSCVQPPEGLISWWPGDGNANDIRDGNNGMLQNGATFELGKVGQAFSFDGMDDYVQFPNSNIFDGNKESTIDAWVRPTTGVTVDPTGFATILAKWAGTYDYEMPFLGYYRGNNHWTWEITTNQGENIQHQTEIPVAFSTWSHVAFVFDIPNKVGRFYLNGMLQDEFLMPQINGDAMASNPTGWVGIGLDTPVHHPWSGLIDEAEVFNRALTADEIKNIFLADSAGKCKDTAPPTIIITGPTSPVILGSSASAMVSVTDSESGVAYQSSPEGSTALDTSSVGTKSLTVTARDNAGNEASVTYTYTVQYSQTAGRSVLPPLQQVSDPSELTKAYKIGSTLPIKFQLVDDNGAYIGGAHATLEVSKVSSSTDAGDSITVLPPGSSDTGNVFRYDSTEQQYQYNLKTTDYAKGYYRIVISLDDNSKIISYFEMK